MVASLALNLWNIVIRNKVDHNNKKLWMKYCVGSGIIAGLLTALAFLFEVKKSGLKSENSALADAFAGAAASPIVPRLIGYVRNGNRFVLPTRPTATEFQGPILLLIFGTFRLSLSYWIYLWLNKSKNGPLETTFTNQTSTSTQQIWQPDNIIMMNMNIHQRLPHTNLDPTTSQLKPHFELTKVGLPGHRLHFADLQELNAYMEERITNSEHSEQEPDEIRYDEGSNY
ncbi:10982_t:CDS:2 [Ambispora gerdemannii]|uniref:10982_t:CDS:1 n=1 Tax=Ambispora gerdemannii TaxID=144530 RepID=A0A9N9F3M9_9GLOM|nr:10982_t:CDS:2 [Ambispora gerdemannii]